MAIGLLAASGIASKLATITAHAGNQPTNCQQTGDNQDQNSPCTFTSG
jgi:hypothetical protein